MVSREFLKIILAFLGIFASSNSSGVHPFFPDCRVPNWEKLVCNPGFEVDAGTNLSWKIKMGSCRQDERKEYVRNQTTLEVSGDDFLIHANLCLRLTLISQDGKTNETDWIAIVPSTLVAPTPVESLKVTKTGKANATLQWKSPQLRKHRLRKLCYRIVVSTPLAPDKVVFIKSKRSKQIHRQSTTLAGLLPGLRYKVTVDCIPMVKNYSVNNTPYYKSGFWSTEKHLYFYTKDGVPIASPGVTNGGFRIKPINQTINEITLYWQNIGPTLIGGKICQWAVKYYDTLKPWDDRTISTPNICETGQHSISHISLLLPTDKTFVATVQAATSVGFNMSISPPPLIIQSDRTRPSPPEDFGAEQNGTDVILHWRPVEGATSYTVFMCPIEKAAHHCQMHKDLEWRKPKYKELNAHNGFLSFHMTTDISQYGYGVSAEVNHTLEGDQQVTSSGSVWSRCSWDHSKAPQPPTNLRLHDTADNVVKLSWKRPNCEESSYIISYTIECLLVSNRKHNEQDWYQLGQVNSSRTSYAVKGLEDGETYQLRVRSINILNITSKATHLESFVTVPLSAMTAKMIMAVVSCGFAALLFTIAGLIHIIRTAKRSVDKFSKVHIVIPERTGNNVVLEANTYSDYRYNSVSDWLHSSDGIKPGLK